MGIIGIGPTKFKFAADTSPPLRRIWPPSIDKSWMACYEFSNQGMGATHSWIYLYLMNENGL
jgi:hypothetical protein